MKPESLHQRIVDDIGGRIRSGEWLPGDRIPFEHELTEEYGCSRMTVNKALSQLVRAGLIERRRRAGSYVRRPRSQAAVLEIHDVATEVAALGLPYRYSLTARTRRKATDQDRALLETDVDLLAVECLHYAADTVFCIEDRLISLEAVPGAANESFADSAPGPWLIEHVPWSAAEHVIRAVAADAHAAATLGTTVSSPCLVFERRTWSNGQPVTFVRLTYPGDSHALVARFEP